MARNLIFTLIGVALVGCSSGTGDDLASFRTDTLASGLVTVTNDGTGQWTEATAWRLEEDLRLGTIEGGGPEQFSQVAWIVEDEGGRIFILDYQSQDIRVFEATGAHSHTIGRLGQGPGELQNAAGLNWGPDGNLWVWGSQRYSVFDPSGEFVTSYPRQVRGVIYPWNGGFLSDGRYFDWGLDRERGPNPNQSTGLTTFYPIQFSPPDIYDTLPSLEFVAGTTSEGRLLIGRKGLMLAQAKDGSVWFAHTDEYTLYRRSIEGDTTLAFSIPSRPAAEPVTEMDSLISRYRGSGSSLEYTRENFAPFRRLVTRVLTDDAGYIYVLPEEEGVPEGTVVDVFDDSGVYLGRMEFGATVLTLGPPPYVTRDHIYAVVNDEFEVPFVVRWRIVRP